MTANRDHQEIERKFLIKRLPRGVRKQKGLAIRQGYLLQAGSQEMRLRREGRQWVLAFKDGSGIARREVEVPLDARQARTLWPVTEGRRLEKVRYDYTHKGLEYTIDIYQGPLAPLKVCEIEFDSRRAAESYTPAPFLGKEISFSLEYKNIQLAANGLPPPPGKVRRRIGALPFLMQDGALHLVIITNRSGSRWILPKGRPEPDMTRQEVALMEAVEEAGAFGTVVPNARTHCAVNDEFILHLYPLKVAGLLRKWPESDFRKRRVLPFEKALSQLHDPEVARSARRLADRLGLEL